MPHKDSQQEARFSTYKGKEAIQAELREMIEDCKQVTVSRDSTYKTAKLDEDKLIMQLTAWYTRDDQHKWNAATQAERAKNKE